jgi:hypothetical protein
VIGLEVSSDASDDVGDAVADGTRAAILEAAQAGFAESQAEVPEATGALKQSGELVETPQGGRWTYDSEYAPYVEGGTEPHYPPIEPLKEWAAIVLGDESAAYGVQEKIAQEGTDPQPFLRPGFQRMATELKRRGVSTDIEGFL